MNIDWSELHAELAHWHTDGLRLPIWWRDDDAIGPTPELDRLVTLSKQVGVPVHLAVVPKFARQALAEQIDATAELIPVVHGWAHLNHAPAGAKKAEFGTTSSDAEHNMQAAMARLRTLFGNRLAPMFVPPWNRIDPDLFPHLVTAGFSMISTYLPRKTAQPVPGLSRINTHIDPIDWRGSRDLVSPQLLIPHIVQLLADRRTGASDNSEPLGYLTHHLVHSDKVWDFTRQFFTVLQSGPTYQFDASKTGNEDT